MDFISAIGFMAAILTSFSFFPQALKTIKTRDTTGISLVMYCVFTIGVLAWLLYAVLINDLPMMMANFFTLIPASIILILKIKGK